MRTSVAPPGGPHVASPAGKRVELRFPDPANNRYYAFSAMLMGGLDGYMELKWGAVMRFGTFPYPFAFDMYHSV